MDSPAPAAESVPFDADLLRRYDVNGPRYTSYPTAPQFDEAFGADAYRRAAQASNHPGAPPLSVYVHVPFCRQVCFYCACNRVITANYGRARAYLDALHDEIAQQAALFDPARPVEQLHLGGGTPNYLDDDDLVRLVETLGRHFRLAPPEEREFSIEIDPRDVGPDTLRRLAGVGFNRISIGVQDVDHEVQKAINRVQSAQLNRQIIEEARELGFHSTNVDLIYGLPRQTRETFDRTLDEIISLRPERIAVYSYAHLPHWFKVQRQIDADELPSAAEKLAILERTIERLSAAGYVYIGMDHFALPEDGLAVAQREGTLHRNFQGYSTRPSCDLIALGPSGIGRVGETYSQNLRDPEEWQRSLARGHLPVFRGTWLSDDDRVRREIIMQLMCHLSLDFADVQRRHGVDVQRDFAEALERLEGLAADGLVQVDAHGIQILPRGRLLMRHVAMAFDAYLNPSQEAARYSKVV